MFSVNRFDGSQSQSQSDSHSSNKVNDKLAKLNQKLQSKKAAINPSTSTTTPSTTSTTPSISTSTPSTSLIHPSRLSIPALRASDNKNKAKSSSNPAGSGSGKTKAKQRYEQAKKARRKNREISKKGKKPGEGKGKNKERHERRDLESRLNRKRERSRSVTATAIQEEKVKVGETQTQDKRNNIFDLKELKRSEKEGKSLDNGWSGRKIGKGGVQEKKINGGEKEEILKHDKEKETDSSDSDSDSDSSSSPSEEEEEEAKTEGEKDSKLQIQEDSTISNQPEPEMEIDPSTIGESIGLSRFPLPKRNMRSDPSLLALQGLSKGLAHPLLVDPSLREKIQINQDEVNGKDKKRKRNEEEVGSEATEKKKGKIGEEETFMDDEDEDEHEEMEDLKEDPSINHSSEGKGKGLELVCEPIRKQLAKIGISEWFAVQATVIPLLLSTPLSRSLYPHSSVSDLCISAPTGSGKTLSYVIPILEVLRRRKVKKLRALVLLPTRDLVSQVKETFDLINKNLISSGKDGEEEELKIGICTGNSSFIQEQNSLVEKKLNFSSNDLEFDDQDSLSLTSSSSTTDENSNRFIYSSKIDILLSTPGRLIDHLKSTKGFDLKHLRFLVIDEADRLMGQSFQEWIGRLEEEIDPKRFGKGDEDQEVDAPAWLKRDQDDLDQEVPSSVQKLLFSATLTRDPSQIQTLNLRNPKYVSVQDPTSTSTRDQDGEEIVGFNQVQTLPSTLIEHMLVLPSSLKPLYLIELLHRKSEMVEETMSLGPIKNALCFTKSLESAKRLVSLLRNFEEIYASLMEEENGNFSPLEIREYSSDLNKVEKREILKEFKEGKVDILICSDLISRGMDLPHVEHVISYDSPVDITKYVHRVGRTARANRIGHAWSLVEEQEARYFKKMQSKAGRRSKVKKEKLPSDEKLEVFKKAYELALNKTAEMFTH